MLKKKNIKKSQTPRKLKLSAPAKVRFAHKKPAKQGLINLNGSRLKVGTSIEEEMWLNKLNVPVRQMVLRGFNNKVYVIDGVDPVRKIAYEFLGCSWHGHYTHLKFDAFNILTKKTNRQMYIETKTRFQYLYDLGWKVFYVWECDFKKGKMGKFYTGIKDML